jgi:hypothetical protein
LAEEPLDAFLRFSLGWRPAVLALKLNVKTASAFRRVLNSST